MMDGTVEKEWWKAISSNDMTTIETLLCKRPLLLTSTSRWGENALIRSSGYGFTSLIAYFLSKGLDVNSCDYDGSTALMYASMVNGSKACKTLIHAGAAIDLTDDAGCTALMKSSISCDIDIVHALLKANANVHLKDSFGRSALSYAAERNRFDVAALLLQYDADINDFFIPGHFPNLIIDVDIQTIIEVYSHKLTPENFALWKKMRLKGLFL